MTRGHGSGVVRRVARRPRAVSGTEGAAATVSPRVTAASAGLVYRAPPPWGRASVGGQSRVGLLGAGGGRARSLESLESWPSLKGAPLSLRAVEPPVEGAPVPPLAHGLDVVLREGGVHPVVAVRDTLGKRGEIMYSKSVEGVREMDRIAQPEEIDWSGIPPYVRASEDQGLRELAAAREGVRYSGSTSSMTSVLSALYHAVSNFGSTRLIGGLSRKMRELPGTFTKFHLKPVAVAIRPYPDMGSEDGRPLFSVDSHSGIDTSAKILRDLGHTMERMLTMSQEEFREKLLLKGDIPEPVEDISFSYMDASLADGVAESVDHDPQFYHYSQAGPFLVRAQIDCRNVDTGEVFDLKTRAVAAIRYNIAEYRANAHQTLLALRGAMHSYEREFYDMVRSVFLKYALQLRIGRMSGAFVTYHNTSRVLGFEFLPLREMEAYVFGGPEWADRGFSASVQILGKILDEITRSMPVAHPDFLKVVVVPRSPQRSVLVYVQKVSGNDPDPLAAENFGEEALTRKQTARRRRDVSPDTDATDDISGRSGVVSVGSEMLEMKPMSMQELGLGDGGKGEAPDARSAACAALISGNVIPRGDVGAWVVELMPVLNGVPTKNPFDFRKGDTFELKYKLTRSEQPHSRLVKDYVQVLADAYSG